MAFCGFCGSKMNKKKNSEDGSEFYGCSQYPGCKFTMCVEEGEGPALDSRGNDAREELIQLKFSREDAYRLAYEFQKNAPDFMNISDYLQNRN